MKSSVPIKSVPQAPPSPEKANEEFVDRLANALIALAEILAKQEAASKIEIKAPP